MSKIVAGVVWSPRGPITDAKLLKYSGPMTIDRFAETLQESLRAVGDEADTAIVGVNAAWWFSDAEKCERLNNEWRATETDRGLPA